MTVMTRWAIEFTAAHDHWEGEVVSIAFKKAYLIRIISDLKSLGMYSVTVCWV